MTNHEFQNQVIRTLGEILDRLGAVEHGCQRLADAITQDRLVRCADGNGGTRVSAVPDGCEEWSE